jgi:hypothetical protein
MRSTLTAIAILAFGLPLTACQTPDDKRLEGVRFAAGNAIAHNNALQRIDPWPIGVQENDLIVPAERKESGEDGAAPGEAKTLISE